MTRKGFTLTEMAIVLGVVGALLAGLWTAAHMAMNNNRLNKAENELVTILNNVRALNANNLGGFSAASMAMTAPQITQAMIAANVFPRDMIDPATVSAANPLGTAALSPWNTPVTVNLGVAGNAVNPTANPQYFWIDFAWDTNNLPKEACANLLGRIAATPKLGLVQVFDGATFWPITANTNYDVTTFANCSGGASFQFSLNRSQNSN